MAEKSFMEERLISSMFCGMWKSRCLSTVVCLGVPELLCNASASLDIEEIARKTGCRTVEKIYKLMRVMAQWGIGQEVSNKRFKANRAMELLRRDNGPSLGHMVAYYLSEEIWSAMFELPQAVKRSETAFELAHGMDFYDYIHRVESLDYNLDMVKTGLSEPFRQMGTIQRRNELAQTYDHAMNKLSQLELLNAQPSVLTVYPWSECRRIMDVGGGEGTFLSQILLTPGCEHIHRILFDFPDVVKRARTFLANEGVAEDRVTILGGNVLDHVPHSQQVDTIIVKNLLVIFTEEEITKALDNCSAMLANGGKLVIVNTCNPEAGDAEHNVSKTGLQPGFRGIHIMSLCQAGQFRTKGEWVDLIDRLSSRVAFKLNQVYETGGGPTLFQLVKSQ